MTDPYKVLGVDPSASDDEIKKDLDKIANIISKEKFDIVAMQHHLLHTQFEVPIRPYIE